MWEEGFGTDQAAFDEAMRSMREGGIAALIGDPAEDAASTRSEPPALANCLSDDELAELNDFLLSDAVSDETMTLDQLDGYLTAIVVGPTCLNVSQWYVGIWGNRQEDVPHFLNLHHAQHVMQLILRHYNGIAASLEQGADTHEPVLGCYRSEDGTHDIVDAETWAHGFMAGVALSRADWQPLFDDPQGRAWLAPILYLADSDADTTPTPQADTLAVWDDLANQAQAAIAPIYRFWSPYRQAIHERQQASTFARQHPKVGRNDPCPYGSGKKFKKCCGGGAMLH